MALSLIRKYPITFLAVVIALYTTFVVFTLINGGLYYKIACLAIPSLLIAIYLAIYFPALYFYGLVLFLPVSVNIEDMGFGLGLSVPGELMIALLLIFIIINLLRGHYIDKELIRHPVTILIAIDMLWMVVTTFTSTMPVISLKYVLIRFSYILVFYLFAAQMSRNRELLKNLIWLYAASFLLVIFYASMKHAQFGFIPQVNHWTPKPFYKDHTVYGAAMAMILPFFISRFFIKSATNTIKILSTGILLFLITGIFLSYSRAVWLSLFVMLFLYMLIRLKLRFRHLIWAGVLVFALLWFFRTPIIYNLQDVESQRGDDDLREHLSSAANIESSASNRERINRWACAFEMIREKPLLGFGPGTYQFQYGPYQQEENMTYISTYLGDRGGVHSEYLKPWVESGIFGLFTFLAVVLMTVQRAFRLIYQSEDAKLRILVIAVLLGLVSYYFHGLVNFFSNTDKIAVLFWGMTAFIVSTDINERNKQFSRNLV